MVEELSRAEEAEKDFKRNQIALIRACIDLNSCYSALDEKKNYSSVEWEHYLLDQANDNYKKALLLACKEMQRHWNTGGQADWTVARWLEWYKDIKYDI